MVVDVKSVLSVSKKRQFMLEKLKQFKQYDVAKTIIIIIVDHNRSLDSDR